MSEMSETRKQEEFYVREERDGFVVGEVMKRTWAAGLQALSDVKKFCEKHYLQFFAVYGTLLGTVRHAGFIPWDDDIDIGMVRDDYLSFLDWMDSEGMEGYQVFNPYTKPWYCMNFSHLVNGSDLSFSRDHLKKWHGCPFLVGPDIYPFYYLPRNPSEEKYILHMLERIDAAIALSRQSNAQTRATGGFELESRLSELLAKILVELEHETGWSFTTDRPLDNQLEILYDQVCSLTTREEADYLTRYDEYAKDRNRKYPKEWLENTIDLPFEGMEMPVPVVYDAVLKARFGDGYMIPVQERALHDYPFYKKQMLEVGNKIEEREKESCLYEGKAIQELPSGKKKVLYHTSVRDMLIYSDCAVDKIESVLDFFRTHKDQFYLYWMPGRFLSDDDMALDEMAPEMIDVYDALIKSADSEQLGIVDVSGKPENAVKICDLFYGDEGLASEMMRQIGKSVFIQDYRIRDEGKVYGISEQLFL